MYRWILVLCACTLLAGCPKPGVVWLVDGETPGVPVFGIGRHRGADDGMQHAGVRVESCDGPSRRDLTDISSVFWLVSDADPGRHPYPAQVTYGMTPAGFSELVAPRPLVPGCYIVASDVAQRLWIQVQQDGRAEEVRR